MENRPSEQPEVPPVTKQQRRKGKERQQEEEEDEFVSKESFSNWKKNYAGKGFVGERGFSQLMTGPDPDTPPGFPGWSRLVESHCTNHRECTMEPHLIKK